MAPTSNSTEGQQFWLVADNPSTNSISVAFIRKAAGLGVASLEKDNERYEHKFEYCDLLVTGSGPSGLASAYAAAKNGAKVILAEDKPRYGGTLLTDEVSIDNMSGKDWSEKIIYGTNIKLN